MRTAFPLLPTNTTVPTIDVGGGKWRTAVVVVGLGGGGEGGEWEAGGGTKEPLQSQHKSSSVAQYLTKIKPSYQKSETFKSIFFKN